MQSLFLRSAAAVVALIAVDVPAQAGVAPNAGVQQLITAASLRGDHDLGAAAGAKVSLTVELPYQQPAELAALVKAQSDRSSALYRKFLTAAQFRAYFAPTVASYTAKARALEQAGFTVETFANRTVIHAVGTTSAADRFFHTTIDALRGPDGHIGYANVTPATIPSSFLGTRIVGLDGMSVAHTPTTVPSAAARPLAAGYGEHLFGPDGGYGPLAIAKSEDFPVEHGYRGAKSNVADIIDGTPADTDIAGFLSAFGIKRGGPRTTNIAVDGGCATACADAQPATQNAEWILAMAPDASFFTYQIPGLNYVSIVDGFNAVVSDDAMNVVNFGAAVCEFTNSDLELAIAPIVEQGAAEGIAIEAAAYGGANLCDLGVAVPSTPADLDTLTAVGSSAMFVDASGNQLLESALGISNGGVSVAIPTPAWQAHTHGVNPAGRNVPDIVIPASVNGIGASFYYGGAWLGGGVTDNNAPFAGYLATVQQMYGYATPLGNIAPALYATLAADGYTGHGKTYFSDVVIGSIGSSGGVPVVAVKGYDLATGIGSISGYALAQSFGFGPIQAPPK